MEKQCCAKALYNVKLPKKAGRRVRLKYTSQVRMSQSHLSKTNDYAPATIAKRLVGALGSNTVSALLAVSVDRPGRWAAGKELPSVENQMQLADLDSVVSHLLTVFTPGQAILWLEGQDPYLGARPLDVYRIDGAGPVIEAMRVYEQGAFA